jgi:putative oxidoreductase
MNQQRVTDIAFLALRAVAGLLFFQAGSVKLFGWYGGLPGGGTVALVSQIGIGAVLEVVGGAAILLGLFTRPVAFVLSGEMAVAYWQFHAPRGGWPIQNQGQPAVLFCFLFLYFAAAGGGTLSLDAMLARRRMEPLEDDDAPANRMKLGR